MYCEDNALSRNATEFSDITIYFFYVMIYINVYVYVMRSMYVWLRAIYRISVCETYLLFIFIIIIFLGVSFRTRICVCEAVLVRFRARIWCWLVKILLFISYISEIIIIIHVANMWRTMTVLNLTEYPIPILIHTSNVLYKFV